MPGFLLSNFHHHSDQASYSLCQTKAERTLDNNVEYKQTYRDDQAKKLRMKISNIMQKICDSLRLWSLFW